VPEIQQIMIGVPPGPASGPSPAEGATDVPRDATLGWTPGEFAQTHDIYLGTSFDDVNEASRSDPRGVLVSQDETAIPYEPVSPLPYGRTQYWRIDEVNGPPDHTVFQGPVWSFTVEPYAYPVTPVAATASSSQPTMEPQRTIDGSGLDESDGHGTEPATMWMSAGVPPNWIQYEFDQVYKLYQVQVWNSNQAIEAFLGFGARKVAIETSTDGRTWTAVPDVPEFAQAPGTPGYAGNTTVSLGGVQAKYVKLTIESNWGGVTPQTGLAEVRFSYVPVQARAPEPANTATEIDVAARLTWRPGREAASHQVYFGTDPNTVANGTIAAHAVTEHGYTPDSLNYGMTYYWRVDEVNAVTYPGEVWSFATQEYAVVDDFESYTDQPGEEIFSTWIDGYADQSSGSTVGLLTAVNGTFGETTIVHGDKQSMPLAYDNTAAPQYSEAVRTFATPQDWTAHGIKSLSLWFRGGPGNGGKLYVKINSTKVAYDGDAGDLARPTWLVWNIDLSQAGNVRSVRTLTIGVEGAGTQGTLYIDDIRLYPKAPEYITPTQASDTALEAHYTFDEGVGTRVGDSSPNANHGTVIGNLQWVTGKVGGAMAFTGSTSDYVEAPEAPNVTGIHSRTATAWIKTTEYGEIVSWGDNIAGQKWIFRVQESNGTLGAIRVEVNGGYQVGSTDVRDDEWHHVAAVLDSDGTPDATESALYVDGILEANSATLDEPINTAAGVVRIGLAPWHNRPFNGLIDDVRIYSRPLSNEELAGLAGRTIPLYKPF
jgi:Concanavalin A-like lectin/glucanases superfamily/F5/8 type C domain